MQFNLELIAHTHKLVCNSNYYGNSIKGYQVYHFKEKRKLSNLVMSNIFQKRRRTRDGSQRETTLWQRFGGSFRIPGLVIRSCSTTQAMARSKEILIWTRSTATMSPYALSITRYRERSLMTRSTPLSSGLYHETPHFTRLWILVTAEHFSIFDSFVAWTSSDYNII